MFQAVRLDDTLYISGQIGLDPQTGEIPPGVTAQAEQVGNGRDMALKSCQILQALQNIGAILQLANSSYSAVISATVFLVDIEDYPAVNEVYQSFFKNDFPSRAAVQASGDFT